jgi:hypothetical protein
MPSGPGVGSNPGPLAPESCAPHPLHIVSKNYTVWTSEKWDIPKITIFQNVLLNRVAIKTFVNQILILSFQVFKPDLPIITCC